MSYSPFQLTRFHAEVRAVAGSTVTTAYQPLGLPLDFSAGLVVVISTANTDVLLSVDGINICLEIPQNCISPITLDLATAGVCWPKGQIFYKGSAAGASGTLVVNAYGK